MPRLLWCALRGSGRIPTPVSERHGAPRLAGSTWRVEQWRMRLPWTNRGRSTASNNGNGPEVLATVSSARGTEEQGGTTHRVRIGSNGDEAA